jgi:SH3-like domain-containing protein
MARNRAAQAIFGPLLGLALLSGGPTAQAADLLKEKDRPTPSGLPVPRYVALKFDTVNARSAPGDEARLLWVYHARGLPVQVVAETADWRRICDPERGLAWVHAPATDGRRMVMRLKPQALPLRAGPDPRAEVKAYLLGRALAQLDRCGRDGWCKLKAGRATGWVPAAEVWGTAEEPQCRG